MRNLKAFGRVVFPVIVIVVFGIIWGLTYEAPVQKKEIHSSETISQPQTNHKETLKKEMVEKPASRKVTPAISPQYIIDISPKEIDLLVQIVQYEVGTSASYYPGFNFDYLQRCMAKLVINRVKHPKFPKTVERVIRQKGQFENWKRCYRFSATHERTRKNVEHVLLGKDKISDRLLYQMSFTGRDLRKNFRKMRKKVGLVQSYHSAMSVDKRHLIFATR